MANPLNATIDYIRSARAELEKVTWPSREEVMRYSALVIGVSVAMAAFFAALDLGLGQAVTALLARRNASAPTAPATAPVVPDLEPFVEATDASGNPADIKVTPIETSPVTIPPR